LEIVDVGVRDRLQRLLRERRLPALANQLLERLLPDVVGELPLHERRGRLPLAEPGKPGPPLVDGRGARLRLLDLLYRYGNGEHHVLDVRHAVLAQGLPQLVVRDPGSVAVLLEDLPVVDQHDALAREQLGDASAPDAPPVDHPVPSDQHTGCYESARQTRVGSYHRVLHGIRDDEKQHQVERGHLAELTGAGEAQPDEQGEVDDGRAERDVDQGVPRSGHGCLKYEPSPCVPSDPKCRSMEDKRPSTDGHHRRETPHAARSDTGSIVTGSRGTRRLDQAPLRPRGGRRGLVCHEAYRRYTDSKEDSCVSQSTWLPQWRPR